MAVALSAVEDGKARSLEISNKKRSAVTMVLYSFSSLGLLGSAAQARHHHMGS